MEGLAAMINRLNGRRANAVSVHSYTVEIRFDGELVLVMESAFALTTDTASLSVNPQVQEVPSTINMLAGCLVAHVESDGEGAVTIVFDNGWRLLLAPDDQYESWTLTAHDGFTGASPGGGLM